MANILKDSITIRTPDDFHLHLRHGDPMVDYAQLTRDAGFGRAIVMPNVVPPVTTGEILKVYEKQISEATGPTFTPLMTFKLYPKMSAGEVRSLHKAGAKAGKYYPAGATTNSSDGLSHWSLCAEAMGEMEKLGMVFSIHGEDPLGPALSREQLFLGQFREMAQAFPTLPMVFEHISSAEGVEMVKELSPRVGATVTAHHLLLTQENIIGGALNPHLFCRPLPKTEKDRQAIEDFVLSGAKNVFFGSDSAPHPKKRKECAHSAAGIFTAPVALPMVIGLFEKKGKLDLLEAFLSENGANFYSLKQNTTEVTFVRDPWVVPSEYVGIVPMGAGKTLDWRIQS